MDYETYSAIKLKFEQELHEIEKEIFMLNNKRKKSESVLEKELRKIKSVRAILEKNVVVSAGLLKINVSYELITKTEKEIEMLDKFIFEQGLKHGRVKEKIGVLDEMLYEEQQKQKKNREKAEEQILVEYKRWTNS